MACPDGVDLIDFTVMAAVWQIAECNEDTPCGPADINEDGSVNLADLALFARNWLSS
ncbi:MAG: hypothetical protein GX455_11810 [Phycisphaerae bacterium]|nr:hypothetical protein [Phycisphaerae bacterium]